MTRYQREALVDMITYGLAMLAVLAVASSDHSAPLWIRWLWLAAVFYGGWRFHKARARFIGSESP